MTNKNSSISHETEIIITTKVNPENIKKEKINTKNKQNRGNQKNNNKTNKNHNQKVREQNEVKEEIEDENRNERIIKLIKRTTIICIILATIVFLMTSPLFNINEIQVSGNERISTETIISLSELKENENIFRNSKNAITNKIKTNAYIESVKIRRYLPDKISINVVERKRSFSIKILNSYAYIGNQGYILEISEEKGELPILEGISTSEENIIEGNRLNVEDLEKLDVVLKIMEAFKGNEINYNITSIDISDKEEYKLYIESERKRIYLGDASSLSNRILYLKTILEAEKEHEGEVFINGNINSGFEPYFREKV